MKSSDHRGGVNEIDHEGLYDSSLHLKCTECAINYLVMRQDAKKWECPWCAIHKRARSEILAWRTMFLDEVLDTSFEFISEKYKSFLRDRFMSLPVEKFRTPQEEWDGCLAFLLQGISDGTLK